MGSRMRFGIFVLALLIASSQSANSEPIVLPCEAAFIEVSANSLVEAERVCAIASKLETSFKRLGLKLTKNTLIEVTEDLDVGPGLCVAFYDTEETKIQVLPPHCLVGNPGRLSPFPKFPASILFESLVVHELVHAHVDQASKGRYVPRIAHEYLAHAIQISLLPEQQRHTTLQAVSITGPVAIGDFNEAVLNFAPLRFAVMAWLHFESKGGDADLVQRVINGEMGFESLEE